MPELDRGGVANVPADRNALERLDDVVIRLQSCFADLGLEAPVAIVVKDKKQVRCIEAYLRGGSLQTFHPVLLPKHPRLSINGLDFLANTEIYRR